MCDIMHIANIRNAIKNHKIKMNKLKNRIKEKWVVTVKYAWPDKIDFLHEEAKSLARINY